MNKVINMRKLFCIVLFVPVLVFSQKGGKNFVINGKIEGLEEGTEVKISNGGDNSEPLASSSVVKGKFQLKGKVPEPGLYKINVGKLEPINIYLENSVINISGKKDDIKNVKITGSVSHNDFVQFENTFNPLFGQLNAAASTINSMQPGPDRDGMVKIYVGVLDNIQKEIDKFINSKPRSYVSPFVLFVTTQVSSDLSLLEQRLHKLDTTIQNSQMGKMVLNYITENRIGSVGSTVVDFTQPDTLGKPVSLSSFRGKYVLLDFWASWCAPCRYENPNVVENFNKFKDKNFTVLSVSLDRPGQKEQWMKAIHDDHLVWTHVSDLQFWNNAAAQLYKINSIPQNILIDPAGKIVGKNLRGADLKNKLCEIFGCN